jgi:hypothetical protein
MRFKNNAEPEVLFSLRISEEFFGKKFIINNEEYVIAEMDDTSVLVKLSDFVIIEPAHDVKRIIEEYPYTIYPNEYFHIPNTNLICINPIIYHETPDEPLIMYGIRLCVFFSLFLTNQIPSVLMFRNLIMNIDEKKYRFELNDDPDPEYKDSWILKELGEDEVLCNME